MLPFLSAKKIASVIVSKHGKDLHDVKPEIDMSEKDESSSGLESCAHDLLKAIDDRSILGIKSALKNAFQILDSEPHVEGEHLNEEE